MTKNPARFFDEILIFLSTDYNRIFNFNEIHEYLFPDDFKTKKFSEVDLKDTNAKNIKNALIFLNKQGLVAANRPKNQYFINTAGFLKIKTRGFEGQIKREKRNNILQRITWIVLPLAGLITALCAGFSLYYSYFCRSL